MILAGRELPKINGSSAGFIALIVCLSVLIVGLCTAVFILLRDHSPSDEERAVRRQLSQRRREQTQAESSSFTYSSSSIPPVSLARKVGCMFGIGATADEKKRSKKGGKSGKGWIQAGSEDESENEVQPRSISGLQKQGDVEEVHSIKLADRSTARDDGPIDPPFRPPQTPYSQTDSTSSVRLYNPYTPSSTPPPLRTAVTRLRSTDSPSPSSASSLALSSTARVLSGSPEPYAADSIDDIHPPGERHFSTNSGGSISTRTSHTGTKFIESL
ncbi:hypothetical protein PILCRDRAFT_814889 [Piloderma croceum F 1598]|uniref:Uncharacterized protein n=1 Tax=Piloderma croceum (strain F 1598) TaxID=765440 RepID=A0A0C3G6E1_PILCF|nr:hypothetical protein PILCRDRAFT_814889 [Piloderma croceum F 1598]